MRFPKYTIVLIVSILSILLIPSYGEMELNFVYYEIFEWKGLHTIHLFVVDGWEEFPEACRDPLIAGCAVSMPQDDGTFLHIIILELGSLTYVDQYGYSTLYHEIKHIECTCDWHNGLMRI